MTDIDSDNDLRALWHSSAPRANPAEVRDAVVRDVRMQRRYLQASFAFGIVVLAYIGWLDFKGVFAWPGVMTAVVAASLLWTAWKARRARRRCPDLAQLSPEQLLRLALRHARAALRNARICHTVVPLSMLSGAMIGPLLVVEGADAGEPAWVTLAWIAIALAFIAGFVVFGLVVARRKKREIRVLERRLREFDDSL
jgi:threonine/homoserine/homoserine lactone efflux protein